MAMIKCKECGKEAAKSAPTCPHCGVAKPGQKGVSAKVGCLVLFGALVLFGVIWSSVDLPSGSNSSSSNLPVTASRGQQKKTISKWAHQTVNVRSGRSTDHQIVAKLNRGEHVQVDSLSGGWFRVHRGGNPVGYTSKSVLQNAPIPKYEVVSWNWVKDPSFGGDGAVIWTVEVRNNTQSHIKNLRVDFTSYTGSDDVIDSDFIYVSGISPGGVKSGKGYATYFGTEKTARIQIDPNQ